MATKTGYDDEALDRTGNSTSFRVTGRSPDEQLTVEMIDSAAARKGMDPGKYVLKVMREHLEEPSE